MSPLLQAAVVAIVVGLSLLSLLRRLAPAAMWQAQARLSYWLERDSRTGWVRRVGQVLRPSIQVTTGTCGTSCSSCKACK